MTLLLSPRSRRANQTQTPFDAHAIAAPADATGVCVQDSLHMGKTAILAVDDDPQVLAAVARDLRSRYGKDYRVVRAPSGAEALDALPKRVLEVFAYFVGVLVGAVIQRVDVGRALSRDRLRAVPARSSCTAARAVETQRRRRRRVEDDAAARVGDAYDVRALFACR